MKNNINELPLIELFIDEEKSDNGIQAISLVESPAIEENFVALSKHKVEFKAIDEDKRIIIGLALVPNKPIYRRKKDYEYNITFSKDTVRKGAEMYLKSLRNNNTTLEHKQLTSGASIIESWIVEDTDKDKTALYNLNATKGSWAVVMKIDNEDVWKDIKDKKYLGLSIEGVFSEYKEDMSDEKDLSDEELVNQIKGLIDAN
jgi:hypothetical protein